MEKELLKAIGALADKIDSMDVKIDRIEARMDKMEARMDNMEARMDNMEAKITKTNLILENEIKPSIQLLVEGHKGNVDNIKELKNTVEEMSATVLALDLMHTVKR